MGLFSGEDFSLKNVITMPIDIFKNDMSFFNELRKDPKGAFGRKQEGMTEILGGVGFDKEHKLNKNSDAVVGSIFAAIGAGALAGGGAAAGGGAGAGGGTVAGTSTGTASAAGGGTGSGLMASAKSGSWLSNPYVQTGTSLLQSQQQAQAQTAANTQAPVMQGNAGMLSAQQGSPQVYRHRGLLS